MFSKPKRKNDHLDTRFQPGGCLSAYLLAQLYLVFVALGAFFLILFSGAMTRQPLLIIWMLILFAVGIGTWLSIMYMWEGDRRGYYGLILSYTLFFLYFLGFTYQFQQAGIPYLILMLINLVLLVIMIRLKRQALT